MYEGSVGWKAKKGSKGELYEKILAELPTTPFRVSWVVRKVPAIARYAPSSQATMVHAALLDALAEGRVVRAGPSRYLKVGATNKRRDDGND